jgi:hypothetical protein
MEAATLPSIVEIKRTLRGQRKEFRCQLVERQADAAIVLFVSTAPYQVGELPLPAGTVTLGHFWKNRDYNVYHWLAPSGSTLAHYFNLAAETSISDDTISWCDLALDVLVRPAAPPVVLDEEDLPADLEPGLRAQIEAACRDVLRQQVAIIEQLEEQATVLWPRLFGVGRS